MAGSLVFTTDGRDAIAEHMASHISKFRLGEGGFVKSALVTETIDASCTGSENTYSYTVTGGDFGIVGVDTAGGTFTVTGDQVQYIVVGAQIKVEGSTGNDGLYTVVSASLPVSDTLITVSETIPDATVDGNLYVDRLPICKGPVIGQYSHPAAIVEYDGISVIQKIEDTTGTGSFTQTSGGTAGTAEVNYKSGNISVEFENDTGVGNTVVFEYKYANVSLSPLTTKTQLDSQGDTTLFTFEKDLESSDISLRGPGWATARIAVNLTAPEGIDDGDSFGGTPYYFEGGIFDEDDVLLVYFTFDKERKTGASIIAHTIDMIV